MLFTMSVHCTMTYNFGQLMSWKFNDFGNLFITAELLVNDYNVNPTNNSNETNCCVIIQMALPLPPP